MKANKESPKAATRRERVAQLPKISPPIQAEALQARTTHRQRHHWRHEERSSQRHMPKTRGLDRSQRTLAHG